MYLHKTPKWLKALYPGLTWELPNKDQTIYLTFDDGPIPDVTDFVVETLRQFGAEATFFCVGENIERHENVFKKVIGEGHTIGNHTQKHVSGWKISNPEYFENIQRCDAIIDLRLGTERKRIFRPPYGKIRRNQIIELVKKYEIIMWDVLAGDFDSRLSASKCLKNSIKHTESGSIVVFHDSTKAEKIVRYVLPRFLEHFSEKGFRFCKI